MQILLQQQSKCIPPRNDLQNRAAAARKAGFSGTIAVRTGVQVGGLSSDPGILWAEGVCFQDCANWILPVLSAAFAVFADNPPLDGVKMTRLCNGAGGCVF